MIRNSNFKCGFCRAEGHKITKCTDPRARQVIENIRIGCECLMFRQMPATDEVVHCEMFYYLSGCIMSVEIIKDGVREPSFTLPRVNTEDLKLFTCHIKLSCTHGKGILANNIVDYMMEHRPQMPYPHTAVCILQRRVRELAPEPPRPVMMVTEPTPIHPTVVPPQPPIEVAAEPSILSFRDEMVRANYKFMERVFGHVFGPPILEPNSIMTQEQQMLHDLEFTLFMMHSTMRIIELDPETMYDVAPRTKSSEEIMFRIRTLMQLEPETMHVIYQARGFMPGDPNPYELKFALTRAYDMLIKRKKLPRKPDLLYVRRDHENNKQRECNETCPVCLKDFKNNRHLVELNCHHTMCLLCLDEMVCVSRVKRIKSLMHCPLCRVTIKTYKRTARSVVEHAQQHHPESSSANNNGL